MKKFCVALAIVCVSSLASAQVPANQPLTASWDASPDTGLAGYRIYLNGTLLVTVAPSMLSCGIPPVQEGTHVVGVSSFTGTGESVRVEVTFTAGTPPAPATNLRIISGPANE